MAQLALVLQSAQVSVVVVFGLVLVLALVLELLGSSKSVW